MKKLTLILITLLTISNLRAEASWESNRGYSTLYNKGNTPIMILANDDLDCFVYSISFGIKKPYNKQESFFPNGKSIIYASVNNKLMAFSFNFLYSNHHPTYTTESPTDITYIINQLKTKKELVIYDAEEPNKEYYIDATGFTSAYNESIRLCKAKKQAVANAL